MGERKVQAKYYPPDFDPSKLPRIKKKRQNDDAVRFMLPMSVRCETCGEFMGTGLKFNARKSDTEENYLGIRIFRFSMKCKSCPATFYIKTDPKNSDYICERGVRRNYEPWRDAKQAEEDAKDERSRQDEDSIQKLVNKTKDAKDEMDELDALDELKSLKATQSKLNHDQIMAGVRAQDDREDQELEQLISKHARSAFERKRKSLRTIPELERDQALEEINLQPKSAVVVQPEKVGGKPRLLKVVKKIKKQQDTKIIEPPIKPATPVTTLVDYASSSDDD